MKSSVYESDFMNCVLKMNRYELNYKYICGFLGLGSNINFSKNFY